jgi:hypothetical protein
MTVEVNVISQEANGVSPSDLLKPYLSSSA